MTSTDFGMAFAILSEGSFQQVGCAVRYFFGGDVR